MRHITVFDCLLVTATVMLLLSLGGCVGSRMDYCADVGRKWGKAKYDECRMVEVLTFPQPRQSVDVYVHRAW
jgi:hypothetical protein